MATKPSRPPTLDYNLLAVLDAVLSEGSVRGAAVRLGVTQSGVSHALRRLRELVGDPLFVRRPGGLVPTARAERLAPILRRGFSELERALFDEAAFEPASAERVFTVASADLALSLLLPPLLARLASEAPGVRLVVRPPVEPAEGPFVDGGVDLALGLFRDAPASLRSQALLREGFLCLLRRGHPAARGGLSLEAFLGLGHVVVSPVGRVGVSLVDDALAREGRARRVVAVVPGFQVVPLVVAESDLAGVLPARLARRYAAPLGLETFPVPLEVSPFTLSALWHERSQRDAGHAWLRKALASVAKGLDERPEAPAKARAKA